MDEATYRSPPSLPTRTPRRRPPTLRVETTLSVAVSITVTVPSRSFVT
ncbi:MAG TPA: hypothetical protein VM936_15595 [Pyrinomonadaceae bacterium]|nr:hypothetical protein [Pyrinomonadaceae bacterium]